MVVSSPTAHTIIQKGDPRKIDTMSFTWLAVKYWAEEELRNAREKLEAAPGVDMEQTQLLRGDIRRLKALLALPEQDSEHTE